MDGWKTMDNRFSTMESMIWRNDGTSEQSVTRGYVEILKSDII